MVTMLERHLKLQSGSEVVRRFVKCNYQTLSLGSKSMLRDSRREPGLIA
jgi:hypothetical protein